MNISSLQKGLVFCAPLSQERYNPATKRVDDLTPYGNHGTSINTGSFTTDRMGQANRAMSFNGTTDAIRIPDSPSLSPTVAMTAMIWAKGAAQNLKGILAHSDTTLNQRSFWITTSDIVPNNGMWVLISDNGEWTAAHRKSYYSSIIAFDDSWHLVGFTFDTGTLKLFIDGVEDTNLTKIYDDAITTIHNSTADVVVGSILANNTASNFFDGDLARPRMWNRALTATEWELAYDSYRPKVIV